MKERNFVPKTETRRLCAHQPITAPGIPAVLFGGKRTWKLQPLPCCEAVLRKAIAIPHRVRSVALACQVTFLHNDCEPFYVNPLDKDQLANPWCLRRNSSPPLSTSMSPPPCGIATPVRDVG